MDYLAVCIPEFGNANVVDQAVVRFPKAVTHFFPGKLFATRKKTRTLVMIMENVNTTITTILRSKHLSSGWFYNLSFEFVIQVHINI